MRGVKSGGDGVSEERLSFRWGIPELDHGNVIIPEPIYRYHGQLGIKGNAFVLIMHLAAFRHESEQGMACPSYQTIADRMGIDRRSVIRLAMQLEQDGWLKIVRREHQTSVFNFGAFAQACWDLHCQEASDATVTTSGQPSDATVTTGSDATVTPLVTLLSPEEQEKKNKKTKNKKESPAERIIDRLNELRQANWKWVSFRPLSAAHAKNVEHINGRLADGFTEVQEVLVLEYLAAKDKGDERSRQFFDCVTPFRTSNFERYLAMAEDWEARGRPSFNGDKAHSSTGLDRGTEVARLMGEGMSYAEASRAARGLGGAR